MAFQLNATICKKLVKIGIQTNLPIKLNYYNDSLENKAALGIFTTTNQRILLKNAEEYTTTIQKIYKANDDFIIQTENSIYLVSGKIKKSYIQKSSVEGYIIINDDPINR
jgi:hypothetical protein